MHALPTTWLTNLPSPQRRMAARWAWLAFTFFTTALFAAGLAEYYRQLQAVCLAPPCGLSPTPEQARAIEAAGLSLGLAATLKAAAIGLHAAVHILVAALLFWQLPTDRRGWFTALVLLTFGTFGAYDTPIFTSVLASFHPAWRVPAMALYLISITIIHVFYLVFPTGRFAPRWLRWPLLLWLPWQVVTVLSPNSWLNYMRWPVPGFLAYWVLYFAALLSVQVYRYRRVSNSAERQQTKWAVTGMVLALGGGLCAFIVSVFGPRFAPSLAPLAHLQDVIIFPFLLLVPLFIGVAILRSRLYDIDLVINRALVYSMLTALLTLAYLGSVITLQSAATLFTGGRRDTLVTVLSTLLIAGAFGPLRRRVQGAIDRRFYRRKYDAAHALARFAASARDETDLGRLSEQLVGVVQETMQPASVGLWLRQASKTRVPL